MGISKHFLSLMEKYGVSGSGLALGYPDYVPERGRKISSDGLWEAFNANIHVLDVGPGDRVDEIFDLNCLYLGEEKRFDFLINPGTYEHVFNIGMAFCTGYRLVKPGGLSYHTAPILRGRHGFWNINEETFPAFYKAQGGQVLQQDVINNTLYVVAKNGLGNGPIVWPQESKRRKL